MSWQQFERLVGESFRRQGYRVLETGGGGADGGVDLVLSRDGEKVLVQCKQWRAFRVGVEVVRELYGVMAARGAAAGIVVTSGRFTEEARRFAQGRNVRLVDGQALRGWMLPIADGMSEAASQRDGKSQQARTAPAAAAPCCPVCGKTMLSRKARRGGVGGDAVDPEGAR